MYVSKKLKISLKRQRLKSLKKSRRVSDLFSGAAPVFFFFPLVEHNWEYV